MQSHQNDPFSGGIAATVIEILQEEQLIAAAAERGSELLQGLRDLQASLACIRDVRGRGAMLGVELRPEWSSRGTHIVQQLLEGGFILDYHAATSTFRLFPPFVISAAEIQAFLQAFRQVLSGHPVPGAEHRRRADPCGPHTRRAAGP